MNAKILLLFLPLMLLNATGCSDEDPAAIKNICNIATDNISFSQHVIPIFNNNCIICHQPGTQDDQRPYLTVELGFDELVANPAIQAPGFFPPMVTAGKPEDSQLYRKIIGDPRAGMRMPQGGPYLSDDEICIIKNWVQQGALNN